MHSKYGKIQIYGCSFHKSSKPNPALRSIENQTSKIQFTSDLLICSDFTNKYIIDRILKNFININYYFKLVLLDFSFKLRIRYSILKASYLFLIY